MATDDEHKLSHISTIYYEEFFLWEEKEFKDDASAECYHSGLCRPKIEYTDAKEIFNKSISYELKYLNRYFLYR